MPDGNVLIYAALAAILFVGVGKVGSETKKHVIKPVGHFIHKIVKHETKTKN